MRDDFDSIAMEKKISTNLALGWTVEGIRRALLEESKDLTGRMLVMEARIVELQDQIEYMEKVYVKPS